MSSNSNAYSIEELIRRYTQHSNNLAGWEWAPTSSTNIGANIEQMEKIRGALNSPNPTWKWMGPDNLQPYSGSSSSSGIGKRTRSDQTLDNINYNESQLVAVDPVVLQTRRTVFNQTQLGKLTTQLLTSQAELNSIIQQGNTVGAVDKTNVEKKIDALKLQIGNLISETVKDNVLKEQWQKELNDSRQKLESIQKQENVSLNKYQVETNLELIKFIFERMSKNRDFDPEVTKQICEDMVTDFERKMTAQGRTPLWKQYFAMLRDSINENYAAAKLFYLKVKPYAPLAGQAAAGLTTIGLAATNLGPQIPAITPVLTNYGVALLKDQSLVGNALGNVANRLTETTGNILISATNLVIRSISAHPVASTFGGLSLLLSAYWGLSQDDRNKLGPEIISAANQIIAKIKEQLQIVWDATTDINNWKKAYNNLCQLMVEFKQYCDSNGINLVDDEYDDVLSVPSMTSNVALSSVASSRASSVNSTASSVASSKASSKADSLSLSLFQDGLTENNLEQFQQLINTNDGSISSSIEGSAGTQLSRGYSNYSNVSSLGFGSQDQFGSQDLFNYTPVPVNSPPGSPSYTPLRLNTPPGSPAYTPASSQSSITPLINPANMGSVSSYSQGSLSGSSQEPSIGRGYVPQKITSDDEASQDTDDDMYKNIGGKLSYRRKPKRNTKKKQYKRRTIKRLRNTRRRQKRNTKKHRRIRRR
jgi:hypothetical protein